jgi:ligand-binding SRPBCC domain-containing protein
MLFFVPRCIGRAGASNIATGDPVKAEVWLPLPPEKVFAFFADAGNLDLITPPWLHFRIVTPRPIEMRVGTIIDYKLRLHGLPLRWRTLIKEWQPPHHFVDEQVRGPYRRWIHEHTFEPCDGGTLARDVVHYAVPLDFILHPLFVRRDIENIFAFRRESLRARFGGKM